MSAPERAGLRVGFLLVVAVLSAAVATWRVLDSDARGAGLAALVGGIALVGSQLWARGKLWTFLDVIAYRAYDATILAAVAWETRNDDPATAVAALVALAGGFLASYFVARGRALGYSIWDSTVNRALRCGLLSAALLTGSEGWLWTLAVVSVLTALVRASQAFKESRV